MPTSLATGLVTPGRTGNRESGGTPPGGSGNWGYHVDEVDGIPQRVYVTGMGVAICGIVMFFAALISASIVRRGLGAGDWRPLELPGVLWLNTAVLIASSFTLVRATRLQLSGDESGFRHWWNVTTALGLLFLVGQLIAWRQMTAAGFFLASSPTAGFFYVFTGAHGLHLAGGIAALVVVQTRRARWIRSDTISRVASLYWHFLTALWIALLLFFVWQKYS
jgi:cytochrome c oxidase subunit III